MFKGTLEIFMKLVTISNVGHHHSLVALHVHCSVFEVNVIMTSADHVKIGIVSVKKNYAYEDQKR